jgi:hypothetical protein
LKRFATKDDLKRFATKDDLKRFATKDDLKEQREEIRQEMRELRKDLLGEIASHMGAFQEWMKAQLEVMVEAINSRLTFEEAERIFVKRSEVPGLVS